MKKQPLLSPHLEVGSRESVLWFSFLASQRWHPLPGECPEAGSCGVTNVSPPPPPPTPQPSASALQAALGALGATPRSLLPLTEIERRWEPLICAILSGRVCGRSLWEEGAGTAEGSIHPQPLIPVPGPQPPCLHPCLLMGPIRPRQERLQVLLIALSPGRTISDTQRMF